MNYEKNAREILDELFNGRFPDNEIRFPDFIKLLVENDLVEMFHAQMLDLRNEYDDSMNPLELSEEDELLYDSVFGKRNTSSPAC